MKFLIKGVLVAALLFVALPEQAQSQSVKDIVRDAQERAEAERERANDRREAERRRDDRADRRDRDRRAQEQRRNRDRAAQNRRGGNGAGPPFCRNGAGHPVHGMQWCRDKGFGSGYTWRPGSIGDIIIGRDTRRSGSLSGRALEDVIGRDASRRVQNLGRQGGFTGNMLGTWIDRDTLELSVGGAPLVRLLDRNGNGRIDQALIAEY
jgi:hypothetical protein